MRALLVLGLVGCGGSAAQSDAPPAVADAAPDGRSGSHALTVIVEPNGNHASELLAAIAAAQQSVYVTMYQLTYSTITNALIARKQAGLDVQVILDGSSTNKSLNTTAYNQLAAANVDVVWSSSVFSYTHEKTVMIDGATAWIMTMNFNYSSSTANREYLAVDTEPADVAEAIAIFKADHAMQPITPTGELVVANTNARQKLVALIDSAKTTLDVEGEEFSDDSSGGITSAVARAAQSGVTVHVVIANETLDPTAIATVKSYGAQVVVTGPSSGNGTSTNPYIHAKALLVDCSTPTTCARGYVGSENFSGGSLGYNRELGVIFDTTTELAKVKAAIDSDYARGTPQ